MKKLLAIIFSLVVVMGLCACGDQSHEPASDNSQKEEVVTQDENKDAETVEKDATTSVSENYKSPDSLSDDFKDYFFRLDNKLYSLPAPVSEFMNDGWTILYAPDTLPANYTHSQGITMKKGEVELSFKVKNFSDVEIETKDAIVIGMLMGDDASQKYKNYESLDFELSGGIKFGMSLSDFSNSVDISKFSIEKSVTLTGADEYQYFEPSNRIYLTFYNDELVGLSFEKNKFD